MTDSPRHRPLLPVSIALTTGLLCGAVPLTLHLRAQTPTSQSATERRFAVVSIRPNTWTAEDMSRAMVTSAQRGDPVPVGIRTYPGGRLTGTRVVLRALVIRAFGLNASSLGGGPSWMNTTFFDVDARADGEATDEELNAMLRVTLAERFKLKTHTETREGAAYVLTMARPDGRRGTGLRPTTPECDKQVEELRRTNTIGRAPVTGAPTTPEAQEALNRTPPCNGTSMRTVPGRGTTFVSGGTTIGALANRLSLEIGRPIIDRSGLSGNFDVVLDFAPPNRAPAPAGVQLPVADTLYPSLPNALESQLGLKLESSTEPVSILVVDSAELPEPN